MKHLKTTIVLLALAMSTTACYKNRTCTCIGYKTPGAPKETLLRDDLFGTKQMSLTTCEGHQQIKQATYYKVECTLD